ncbi:MAG: SDR family NAD(P)-dependent oxidoreductase [Actinomycetota bacterium]|nr:SDR family NAD(P)-dependent oxidoreductase [Actinomycetota bacterium]
MHPIDQQTALVTGATDGMGKALAGELAARGATVLLHGRNEARLEAAVREIRQGTGNERVRPYRADFSGLDEVRKLAEEVKRDTERLDLLINNAAVGIGRPGGGRQESADGYELRFAVNYLAPFLLTNLLLALLRRSAPARVVNVASAGQIPIDFDDVMLERHYDGMRAYCQSKLALVMFTFELAPRLCADGERFVAVNALHPATLMTTTMVYEAGIAPVSSIEDGVEATMRLAVSPELDGVTGRYFEGMTESRARDQAYDTGARRRLWRLSETLVGWGATSNQYTPFRPDGTTVSGHAGRLGGRHGPRRG